MDYCRVCGAENPTHATYTVTTSDPEQKFGVSIHNIVEFTYKLKPQSAVATQQSVRICRTCKEPQIESAFKPIGFVAPMARVRAIFIVAKELAGYLAPLELASQDFNRALPRMARKARKYMLKMGKAGGALRCRGGWAGYRSTISIGGFKIRVHMILDNGETLPGWQGVRLAFGGGHARCP